MQAWIRTETAKLDSQDALSIWAYGAETQEKLSRFSKMFTVSIQQFNIQDSIATIEDIIQRINGNERGFWLKFQRVTEKKKYYDDLISYMNKIALHLQLNQTALLKDLSMLEQLNNYINECDMEFDLLISQGQLKLQDVNMAGNKNALMKDWEGQLSKRLEELQYSKVIAEQCMAQIQILIENDKEIINQIREAVTNTIPLWRNQVAVAADLHEKRRVQQAQDDVSKTMIHASKKMIGYSKADEGAVEHSNQELVSHLEEIDQSIDRFQKIIDEMEKSFDNRKTTV